MALKDLLALADKKLHDVFHAVAYDPAADRQRTIARIDDQRAKFHATEPAKGKKDFAVKNNVVEYSPVVPRAGALSINGDLTHYIPSERFTDFLDALKAEVANGSLDRELEAAHGDQTPAKTPRAARAARPSDGKGWSEERRARFSASIAARKAAKGQQ